jgi:hypothetical protein
MMSIDNKQILFVPHDPIRTEPPTRMNPGGGGLHAGSEAGCRPVAAIQAGQSNKTHSICVSILGLSGELQCQACFPAPPAPVSVSTRVQDRAR